MVKGGEADRGGRQDGEHWFCTEALQAGCHLFKLILYYGFLKFVLSHAVLFPRK